MVLEHAPTHAARGQAPVTIARDDRVLAVEFARLGSLVRLNEVDEDDLEDAPTRSEGVFQGYPAAMERALGEVERVLREPEANSGHTVLRRGEGKVLGDADDARQAAVGDRR